MTEPQSREAHPLDLKPIRQRIAASRALLRRFPKLTLTESESDRELLSAEIERLQAQSARLGRLLELAYDGAKLRHYGAINSPHPHDDFSTCPHPDCALLREDERVTTEGDENQKSR